MAKNVRNRDYIKWIKIKKLVKTPQLIKTPKLFKTPSLRPKSLMSAIDTLIKGGNKVKFRKRKDGGYIITKINNLRFTGAKGNAYARSLTGKQVSNKQLVANRRNVLRSVAVTRKSYTQYTGEKLLRKLQSEIRKAAKAGKSFKGKFTKQGYREYINQKIKEGMGISDAISEADRTLRVAMQKIKGFAYDASKRVIGLTLDEVVFTRGITNQSILDRVDRIKDYLSSHEITEQQWMDIMSSIPDQSKTDKEVQALYDSLGDDEEVMEEALNRIEEIIGIDK